MNQFKKIFIGVIILILAGGVMYWYAVRTMNDGCSFLGGGASEPVISYFSEALEEGFIEKKEGRPIEGFEPFMFMEAYLGLQPRDFSCVNAYGGFYVVNDGQVVFNLYKSIMSKRSTAERSITAPGMSQLLQNIAERLGRPLPHTEAEVDDVIRSISLPENSRTTSGSEIPGPHLSLPTVPFGWYAHRTSDSSYFITKQKDLPDVGAVESSAYGDSVSVSLTTTTRSPEAWVAEQEWLADEALIRSKIWVDMHGHHALQVQRETEASPALTDFLFIGNRVYTITLYPYPDSQALGVFNDLLDKYASDPAYVSVSDAQARANCETLVFPHPELEKDIIIDAVTGIVTVGYLGENNEKKTVLLNYKNDHSYAGCSADAHKILSTIKTQRDKYDADMKR